MGVLVPLPFRVHLIEQFHEVGIQLFRHGILLRRAIPPSKAFSSGDPAETALYERHCPIGQNLHRVKTLRAAHIPRLGAFTDFSQIGEFDRGATLSCRRNNAM